jgi:mono/diheme cytochrome c family protein
MIPARMSRPIRVLLISSASVAVAAFAMACGTEKLSVPPSDPTHTGAVLFSQRCGGCHTLSYAATHGSATNVRTREITNGPNFNVRCERPVTRVLYAIENGGFSGATMPQNVVVGPQAIAVAEFVAKYAGRQAPKLVGAAPCDSTPIGSIPTRTATTASTPATTTSTTAGVPPKTTTTAAPGTKKKAAGSGKKKK